MGARAEKKVDGGARVDKKVKQSESWKKVEGAKVEKKLEVGKRWKKVDGGGGQELNKKATVNLLCIQWQPIRIATKF